MSELNEWPECLWCPGTPIAWDDVHGWYHLNRALDPFVTWCDPYKDYSDDPEGPGHCATPKDGRLTPSEREGTTPI